MSDILWLTENIRELTSHIAMLDSELLRNPEERGLAANMRSFQKRLAQLENEFAQETKNKGRVPDCGSWDHVWTVEEIANLAAIEAPKTRGPYQKRKISN